MKKTQYVYESRTGNSVIVTADQVGEKWIQVLQEEDRELENAERKYRYHEPVHYDSFNSDDDSVDTNPYLTDFGMEPLRLLIKLFCEEEQRKLIRKLQETLVELTPTQLRRLLKLAEGMTIAEIARSENAAFNSVKESLETARKILRQKLKNV